MSQSMNFPHKPVEDRVDALMARMTLEEKIGQLNQVHLMNESHFDATRRGLIGSSIFASSAWAGKTQNPEAQAELCNSLQRIAVEESRLGIPILFARDVIHGHRTVFPIPLGQAAAWDPELVRGAGEIAARECTAVGVKWVFTPMLDIARDARWGRIAEGYGEDTFLASKLAGAVVRGLQGEDYSAFDRAVACAKHYAGYGAAEGGRDYDHVEISEGTLRDVYLPPFREAVRAGLATVMSGFHDLNGIPVAANHWLLTDILRDEWGFDGFVVSDWNAVGELLEHGVAADRAHAAALAVEAGVDMDMVSNCYVDTLAEQVRSGKVPLAVIDEAARRVLRIKFACGLFENPYVDTNRANQVMLTPQHRAYARDFARQTMVLLKNEGDLLPLGRKPARVMVMGPLAQARSELFGTWTLDGRAEDVTSIAEALKEAAPEGVRVVTASERFDDQLYHARYSDVVVMVVGEHPIRSGEASSVTSIELPPGQREMIEQLALNDIPVVLVVVSGRPLALSLESKLVNALIYAWAPGVEGGRALADLIFGEANFSGRLPVTLPRATGQAPIYYNRRSSGRPLRPTGDCTTYIDLPVTPLYPFGYGLSYTRFSYAGLALSQRELAQDGELKASVRVTNTGNVGGTETVQLYIRDLVGQVSRPMRELKGFQKVYLQPGETQTVAITLRAEDLAFTGRDGQSVLEAGDYHLWVGPDSTAGLEAAFRLLD